MMKTLTIEADAQNIDTVLDFVDEELEAYECGIREQMAIHVAIDELFANISMYAYTPGTGSVTIGVELFSDPKAVEITFTDSGIPFDPLKKADPDTALSLEEREVGGMGILIVKKSMDAVRYVYADGKNNLTIRKEF